MKHSITAILLLITFDTSAADINGYTAKYEKQIGTPPPCSAIISSANDSDWSKLNDPSYRIICIEPGDYSSKGVITLTASGSKGNERWLRYYRSNDTDDEPWNQSTAYKALIRGLYMDGANFWIIHRLAFDGGGVVNEIISHQNSEEIIYDRILVENGSQTTAGLIGINENGNHRITLQNSVVRKSNVSAGTDRDCMSVGGTTDTHIVNNEIYGCNKSIYHYGGGPVSPGLIIENNDLYVSNSLYTDCSGNLNGTGPCSASEAVVEFKNGGISSNPIKVIHNRIWGGRPSDTSICCLGGGTQGYNIGILWGDYILFQNNINFDGQQGIVLAGSSPDVNNLSIVGNILNDFKEKGSGMPTMAMQIGKSSEVYLNTVIDTTTWIDQGYDNQDIRCNVFINAGNVRGGAGSGLQLDYNAFYNTTEYTTENLGMHITYANASDAKHQAYCFHRKLRTNPEQVCIPNARATSTSPHHNQCPLGLGSRTGVGISDDLMF